MVDVVYDSDNDEDDGEQAELECDSCHLLFPLLPSLSSALSSMPRQARPRSNSQVQNTSTSANHPNSMGYQYNHISNQNHNQHVQGQGHNYSHSGTYTQLPTNNVSNPSYENPYQQAPQPQPLPLPSQLMSPTSKLTRNLKMLHRHDHTIHTIVDQYPLVTMYHLDAESEWESFGCEGPMFVFERTTEPRYGYIILNRIGMEDFVQYCHPSEDYEVADNLLMCQIRKPPNGQGCYGFWTQSQTEGSNDPEDQDPMTRMCQTLMRINRCLRKGVPFTYRDHPPAFSPSHTDLPPAGASSDAGALNMLFAKLGASDTSASAPAVKERKSEQTTPRGSRAQPPAPGDIPSPRLSGSMLLSSIFASAAPAPPSPPQQYSYPLTSNIMGSNSNLTLPNPNPTPPPPPPIPSTTMTEPYSPRPQILTPGIIDAIMGRSASTSTDESADDGRGVIKGLGLGGIGNSGNANGGNSGGRGGTTPTPGKSSTPVRPNGIPPHMQSTSTPSPSHSPSNRRKDKKSASKLKQKVVAEGRNLVPFDDESDLWPYPNHGGGEEHEHAYAADHEYEQNTPERTFALAHRNTNHQLPIWDVPPPIAGNVSSPSPGPGLGTNSPKKRPRPSKPNSNKKERAPAIALSHSLPGVNPKASTLNKDVLQEILASSYLTYSNEDAGRDEFVNAVIELLRDDEEFVEGVWKRYVYGAERGRSISMSNLG